jgi:hypothetical protein
MPSESELTVYAIAEASNMGLQKVLDIKINHRLSFDYYTETQYAHKIRLIRPCIRSLRHELGHAYMAERIPKLYAIFDKILKPFNLLSENLGSFITSLLYITGIGVTLPNGIIFAFTDRPVILSLPLLIVGMGLCAPMIDEVLAAYFGRKYKPDNHKIINYN